MWLMPAGLDHVVKQAGPHNQHLMPCQVLIWDNLARQLVQSHWLQEEGVIGPGKGEGILSSVQKSG